MARKRKVNKKKSASKSKSVHNNVKNKKSHSLRHSKTAEEQSTKIFVLVAVAIAVLVLGTLFLFTYQDRDAAIAGEAVRYIADSGTCGSGEICFGYKDGDGNLNLVNYAEVGSYVDYEGSSSTEINDVFNLTVYVNLDGLQENSFYTFETPITYPQDLVTLEEYYFTVEGQLYQADSSVINGVIGATGSETGVYYFSDDGSGNVNFQLAPDLSSSGVSLNDEGYFEVVTFSFRAVDGAKGDSELEFDSSKDLLFGYVDSLSVFVEKDLAPNSVFNVDVVSDVTCPSVCLDSDGDTWCDSREIAEFGEDTTYHLDPNEHPLDTDSDGFSDDVEIYFGTDAGITSPPNPDADQDYPFNLDCDDYFDQSLTSDAPDDFLLKGGDCDDEDDTVGAGTLYFEDLDRDGLGNIESGAYLCPDEITTIHVTDRTDSCDDYADSTGACESCDAIYYEDLDGDGYGSGTAACSGELSNPVAGGTDCDDSDSTIGAPSDYIDSDGDGYGNSDILVCEGVDDGTDCDDAVYSETNICGSCASGESLQYVDSDSDGYGAEASSCVLDGSSGYVSVGDYQGEDCDDSSHDVDNDCSVSAAVEAATVTIVDSSGAELSGLSSLTVGGQYTFDVSVTADSDFSDHLLLLQVISSSTGEVELLVSQSMPALTSGSTESMSSSFTPTAGGDYTAQLFVWDDWPASGGTSLVSSVEVS